MKSTFIHIDTAVMIGQLHLKGYELLVYALVSGLSKGGSEWVKKPLQWYADTLCDGKKSIGKLSNAFNKLVEKGLLEKTQEGTKKYYRITCQKGNNILAEKESITCQKGNNILAEKESYTLYNNNIKNNKGNNARAREDAPPQKNQEKQEKIPSPQPPSIDDYAAVTEAWQEHYQAATGTGYEFISGTTTDDLRNLASVIRRKAATAGLQPDQSIKDFARNLYDRFHSVADQWQISHWTLHTVLSQFNELYKRILKNESTKSSTNRHVIVRSTEQPGADF